LARAYQSQTNTVASREVIFDTSRCNQRPWRVRKVDEAGQLRPRRGAMPIRDCHIGKVRCMPSESRRSSPPRCSNANHGQVWRIRITRFRRLLWNTVSENLLWRTKDPKVRSPSAPSDRGWLLGLNIAAALELDELHVGPPSGPDARSLFPHARHTHRRVSELRRRVRCAAVSGCSWVEAEG